MTWDIVDAVLILIGLYILASIALSLFMIIGAVVLAVVQEVAERLKRRTELPH